MVPTCGLPLARGFQARAFDQPSEVWLVPLYFSLEEKYQKKRAWFFCRPTMHSVAETSKTPPFVRRTVEVSAATFARWGPVSKTYAHRV